MAPHDTLLTERLRLCPPRADDTAFAAGLLRDKAVRRYLGGVVVPDRMAAAMAGLLRGSDGGAVWLVETRAARKPVGLISLTPHKDGVDTELSYQFHPSAWGEGYAAEAGRAVLEVARSALGLERVIAETQEANMPSRRLLGRLGMTESQRVVRFGCRQVIYMTQVRIAHAVAHRAS